MSKKYNTSTLEYYNYGEQNNMETVSGFSCKVKVSDKDGNIITIEKDGALYAMVGLELDANTGVLKLTDIAHSGSTLAEVEMPDADYIYNCRFDEDKKAILFDVKSLYGDETNTIELDVESLIELYDAGNGIEIGEKDEVTGRRPISIKLAEGENILQVSESGLSISDAITTDDELAAAISGKADISYVNEAISGISGVTGDIATIISDISGLTDSIEQIKSIIGTEDDDPNLDERIDSKADLDEFNDLENEVGELEASFTTLSGDVATISELVTSHEEKINEISNNIDTIDNEIDEISGKVDVNVDNIEKLSGDVISLSGTISNINLKIEKVNDEDLPENVREAYILTNDIGEQLGEQINVYKDSSLISISFIPETQTLRYKFYEVDGQIRTVDVDLSQLVIESEVADGLQVNNGVISIKIDPTSDSYLSVSEDGLKLSGITESITALEDANNQLSNTISSETSNREFVDAQLWAALSAETQIRSESINELQNSIEDNDREIRQLISEEKEERIANDSALSGSIEVAEATLRNAIEEEANIREHEDDIIRDLIETEVENRIAGDNEAKQYVFDKISPLSASIETLDGRIDEETSERIRKDNELESEIGTFRDLYAKKEYVDSKDLEWAITTVTSATSLSNQYSDLKNSYLEAELKQYCDNDHDELENSISDNTTKINAISNLIGVSGSDTSNYDNSGNGILDVLHKEFHEYKGQTAPIARGAQIRNVDEVALGRYNISNKETDQMTGIDIPSGCTIFSIGIGTSDDVRKNALEVRQDGSVYMWIEGEYMCINNLLAMLAHETY